MGAFSLEEKMASTSFNERGRGIKQELLTPATGTSIAYDSFMLTVSGIVKFKASQDQDADYVSYADGVLSVGVIYPITIRDLHSDTTATIVGFKIQ